LAKPFFLLTIHNQHVGNNNVTDDGEAVGKSGLRLRSASDLGRGRDCAKAQGKEKERTERE
jgi:hypothetical protein